MSLILDPAHQSFNPFDVEISKEIWRDKYRFGDEVLWRDTAQRIAAGIYVRDDKPEDRLLAIDAMSKGLWMPGGRIIAGAGTNKKVTLNNCYVSPIIRDSIEGIADALKVAMLTLKQGGGIGMDFSTLRPYKAALKSLGGDTYSSGAVSFMDLWDTMCRQIMSAGYRRGAMMATMICTHPDIIKFIEAKTKAGILNMFNVSVLVTDEFMQAVTDDSDWALYFKEPPVGRQVSNFKDDSGVIQHNYQIIKARYLWNLITKMTYTYSEPGIIFIDRINSLNNLNYIEEINCTNPCVTGDTKILTNEGYVNIKSLVDNEVDIWNGEKFSTVTPFSTGINSIMEVVFSAGSIVKCTPEHKWVLQDGSIKKTKNLKKGDALCKQKMPFIAFHSQTPNHDELDGYTQGFYAGDGSRGCTTSKLYSAKYSVQQYLRGSFSKEYNYGRGQFKNWCHGLLLNKYYVPNNRTIEYMVAWLAGLLDADGNLAYPSKTARPVVQLISKDRYFLNDIQMMLSTIQIACRVNLRKDGGQKEVKGVVTKFQDTFCLMLNVTSMHKLVNLGLKCHRLDYSLYIKVPGGTAYAPQRVKSVKDLGFKEETYCFTEPLKNMGVFNGILGHNCGEQPLPPSGACNLGAVNLARMVKNPFLPEAEFDFKLLSEIVPIGVIFLDNVVDVTRYPLPAQEEEQRGKRRIGLGISGLADALAMMGITYGFKASTLVTQKIMQTIAECAYKTSAMLAKDKGQFPLYQRQEFNHEFISKLSPGTQSMVSDYGLRNGVLLTIAPTGTTSLLYGNISSGCEPVFQHSHSRKVLQPDGEYKRYQVVNYGKALYDHLRLSQKTHIQHYLEPYDSFECAIVSEDITVEGHIAIQAACQQWIDASVSKTINLPEDISYEQFQEVYSLAYKSGCKGCTTYKPSEVRGAVLEKNPTPEKINEEVEPGYLHPRPSILRGATYKVKWPSLESALYVTINDYPDIPGKPFEIFIDGKSSMYADWTKALCLMISSIMRTQKDASFIPDELMRVVSGHDSAWVDSKYHNSLVAYIGYILKKHMQGEKFDENPSSTTAGQKIKLEMEIIALKPVLYQDVKNAISKGMTVCPKCEQVALIHQEGCNTCTECNYSTCT